MSWRAEAKRVRSPSSAMSVTACTNWMPRIACSAPTTGAKRQPAISVSIARVSRSIETEMAGWRFAPVVGALQAMRGIQFVHAVTLIAELGDLTRFHSARSLMGYLGLVPREDSSGEHRH